jgi:hypothetical protein
MTAIADTGVRSTTIEARRGRRGRMHSSRSSQPSRILRLGPSGNRSRAVARGSDGGLDCFVLRQGCGGQVVVPQGALLASRVAMTI